MVTVEKDLLVRLKNADQEAFRQVYELYIKKVYRFIYRYVRNTDESEDLTQEVFLRIWEHRQTIRLDKCFDGFIFTIAYRKIIDYYRLASKKQFAGLDDLLISNLASELHSDELLAKHQIESFYEKALQEMPPKRREVFLLSRHEGLSNQQIAEKMHISVKTVENQMTSALSFLKSYLLNTDGIALSIFFTFILM